MKNLLFILLTSWIILATACSRHTITEITVNGRQVMQLNMKDVRDSARINLSDMATDLRFVRLETRPECLIAAAKYYISDNYILARTRTAIYQFDSFGRYIRTLAVQGQGPREFSRADLVIDEKNNRVIISDESKTTYLLSFDLTNGNYLGDIPKAVSAVTRRMCLTAYGSLACVPYMEPGGIPMPYFLYWQDMNGKLLDYVPGRAGLAIMRDNYLERIPEGYRYMLAYNNRDTIYTLKDKTLLPYLVINHGETVPENMEAEGYRAAKIAMETQRYLFLTQQMVTRAVTNGNSTTVQWTQNEFVLDKKLRRAYPVKGIFNDFMGDSQPVSLFSVHPDNIICLTLQALEVIGIAERAIEDPKSDQKLIGRMMLLKEAVGREDNPVLLVGKIRF